MSVIDKSKITYLGETAQKKMVKLMVEEPLFLSNYITEVNESEPLFNVPYMDKIIRFVCDKYTESGRSVSWNEIALFLSSTVKTTEEQSHIVSIIKELKEMEYGADIETVKEVGIAAIRKSQVLKVLNDSVKRAENMKGYNVDTVADIQLRLERLTMLSDGAVEEGNLSDLDSLKDSKPSEKIPTGIEILDSQLNGGIPKGSLAMLIAGTGVGKTSLSTIICNGAANSKRNVLQIFFEDSMTEIKQKHIAAITGRISSLLYEDEFDRAVEQLRTKDSVMYDNVRKHLRLERMQNGVTSVEDIKSLIKKKINLGFKPDMIMIDYLSCLQGSENKNMMITNECQIWERAVKKLELMAKEYDVAIWICQQTNRNGMSTKTANDRISNIQGSFRATQPCSFIMYLDRTLSDKTDFNRANLYLDKCRGCLPRSWENIYLNNGTCQIDLSDSQNEVFNELEYNENETFKMNS